MKYGSFIAVTTALICYLQFNSQVLAVPQGPAPVVQQELCTNLVASPKLDTSDSSVGLSSNWVVVKVTFMSNPPTNLDVSQNVCSVFSYVNNCGTIQYSENRTATTRPTDAYAYNQMTQDIVHYQEVFTSQSDYYEIWKGEVVMMEDIEPDYSRIQVNPIPDEVQALHETVFAAVAISTDSNWIIFESCDQQLAWVSVAQEAITSDPNYYPNVKVNIEQALSQLNIDPSTMVDIDTTFPQGAPSITQSP